MKILIITQQKIPHSGGLSTHIGLLISGLLKKGHEVKLVSGNDCHDGKIKKAIRLVKHFKNDDEVKYKNFKSMLSTLSRKIEKEIIEFQPDVIHSHDVYASYAYYQIDQKHIKATILQTIHGPALYEAQMGGVDAYPKFKNLIIQCEKTAFENIKHFIAVDSGQKAILVNDYKVPGSLIEVIFNGVDVDEVRELSKIGSGYNPEKTFFLVPRRLVEKTGVRYAIEAMTKMKNKNNILVIAGNGPLRKELEELTNKLNLNDRVVFLGAIPREKLMSLFAKAKAVIIPSVPVKGVIEATSLAVTEAMAVGTVPVASNIGGLAELIEDAKTGYLVEPFSSIDLANKLDGILENEEGYNRVVQAGLLKVEEDYSVEVWLNKVILLYKGLA